MRERDRYLYIYIERERQRERERRERERERKGERERDREREREKREKERERERERARARAEDAKINTDKSKQATRNHSINRPSDVLGFFISPVKNSPSKLGAWFTDHVYKSIRITLHSFYANRKTRQVNLKNLPSGQPVWRRWHT
jgi:FtsZ-interacting cell division protein YlmF